MKTCVRYFLAICILITNGLAMNVLADSEEDECNAYNYDNSKKRAHIYETLPSGTSYLGWYYDNDERKNLMALCVGDKIKKLHLTKANGTKGTSISVNYLGEPGWNLSFCGNNDDNTLIGALPLYWSRCDGQLFSQVVAKDKYFKVYTLAGDDTVLGIISNHYNTDPKSPLVAVLAGSGNDYIDMAYYQSSNSSQGLIPAYSLIKGESGDDDIRQSAYSNWQDGDGAYDTCLGGSGNDWLHCVRFESDSYCDGNAGTDTCDCSSEKSCEKNF